MEQMLSIAASASHLGDLTVVVPIWLMILSWLLLQRAYTAARWFMAATIFTAALTVGLKIVFLTCSTIPTFRSPSGHASQGTLILGALTFITALAAAGALRALVIAAGVGAIAALAASRVVLGAHSSLEVLVGLAIGAIGLLVFARGYRIQEPKPKHVPVLVALAMGILALELQFAVNIEALLKQLGFRIAQVAAVCGHGTP